MRATQDVIVSAVSAALILTVPAPAGEPPCDMTKLTASDAGAEDWLGLSVSISGDFAVAGASRHDDNGSNSGAVYVYAFDSNAMTWMEVQELQPADSGPGRNFGRSVAIDGAVMVVGASGDGPNGGSAGAAYVFRFDGSAWNEEATLVPADNASGDFLGTAVAIHGDVIAVGASGYDDNGSNPDNGSNFGAAYVYRFDGGAWIEEDTLLAADRDPGDSLGGAVAVHGDVIIAGAQGDDDNGGASGSAYVFRHDGVGWGEEAKLLASDGASPDWFGAAVSIEANVAVVGARQHETATGAAYVFRFDGSSWSEEQQLLALDGDMFDNFGAAVNVDDGKISVGASNDDGSGSVYLYAQQGSSWVEQGKFTPPDGQAGDQFGASLCRDGPRMLVGAYSDDDAEFGAGSAYVLELDCTPACPADVNGDGGVGVTDLTFVILAWGQSGGAADVNQDGIVDVLDLVQVITNWGACG